MSRIATGSSLGPRGHAGVRAVMTGQVGVDKKPVIDRVAEIARKHGKDVAVCHVGDMMYAEAPDIVAGKILDLPRSRLDGLRRSVFKDILRIAEKADHLLVNTHATFRWKHGLFPAFDHDQMVALDADLYFTLVDNVDAVHERLTREHDLDHTLKDILVWREEEVLATEVMSRIIRGHGCFYVIARGVEENTAESVYRLMFEPHRRKVYPSFPITHVMDMPQVQAEINTFRDTLAGYFITFDPGDLDEKRLLIEAGAATQRGEKSFTLEVHGRKIEFPVYEVTFVASDIEGQIYARDFKLIDQSDMIVSYVPELPGGKPGLSSGVERELQHAYESTKEVYVVWRPEAEPSPFVTKTANQVFRSIEEALQFFRGKGYIEDCQVARHDAKTSRHPQTARVDPAMDKRELAARIDHTLLKPEAQAADIDRLCDEAIRYGFATACVNPIWVVRVADRLAGSAVGVCTAVGFPLGASRTDTKVHETKRAIDDGAVEIDMVARVGDLAAGNTSAVRDDIAAVAEAVHAASRGHVLKVILETAALTEEQIIAGCRCCIEARADFVKTSTGFHPAGGATVGAVRLLHRHASPLKVKASGGIRDAATAIAMIEAGADRLGCSASVQIVGGLGIGD